MTAKPVHVAAGAALGIGPALFLVGAVTTPAIATAGAVLVLAGFITTASIGDKRARDFTMVMAGLSGGIAMAALNLFFPAGPEAFPGGPGVTWLSAMLMFGGATPALHPIHRRHADLRARAAKAGILDDHDWA